MRPVPPTETFPIGSTAAYDPSVGVMVIGGRESGYVLYTFEKEQQSAYAVITPDVSE